MYAIVYKKNTRSRVLTMHGNTYKNKQEAISARDLLDHYQHRVWIIYFEDPRD